MRSFAALPAVIAASLLFSLGCEKPAEPETPRAPESRVNEYSTRLEAAGMISDVSKREAALVSLVREASADARLEAVKQGLAAISDIALRDKAAGEAALKLDSRSASAGALSVAQSIADTKLRDEVLAKIVVGPTKK